jgi:hypothetical protein
MHVQNIGTCTLHMLLHYLSIIGLWYCVYPPLGLKVKDFFKSALLFQSAIMKTFHRVFLHRKRRKFQRVNYEGTEKNIHQNLNGDTKFLHDLSFHNHYPVTQVR